jgi:hypothetical protein
MSYRRHRREELAPDRMLMVNKFWVIAPAAFLASAVSAQTVNGPPADRRQPSESVGADKHVGVDKAEHRVLCESVQRPEERRRGLCTGSANGQRGTPPEQRPQ